MRCQEARMLIYTYLDGCLAGQVERAFFAHLSQCKNCQQELEYARQTHALLEKFCTPVEPPADFVDQVMAALDRVVPQETAGIGEPVAPVRQDGHREKQKRRGFVWNFRRLAQVASFVVLSAAVWFGTMFNGGLQLARTPDLGVTPETGYEQPGEQVEKPDLQQEQGTVRPGNEKVGPSTVAGEEETASPERTESGEPSGETGQEIVSPGAEGDSREVKPEEVPVEDPPAQPVQVAQAPAEHSVPEPEIMEPAGLFMAAGAEGPEALNSVSLQRVAVGEETQHYNGIITGNKVRYLEGALGSPLTIWEAGMAGENPRPLGKTGKPVTADPVWSPDGNRLAYLHRNEERLALYIDDLAGGAVEVAPSSQPGEIKHPVWSGKGELAYLLAGEGNYHIAVSNGQDSPVVAATDYLGSLAWSPDGNTIAYGKNGHLYTVNRDGSQEKALVKLEGQLQGIAWSSDGRIAVSVKGTGNRQGLWVGKADGTDWQKVAETGGGRELKWSPDGRKVAFTDVQGMGYLLTFAQDGKRDKLYAVTPERGNGGAKKLAWSSGSDELILEWAPTGEPTGIWKAVLP